MAKRAKKRAKLEAKKPPAKPDRRNSVAAEDPDGGAALGGIAFPSCYRPTASFKSNNNYFPGTETLASDEMRISFPGSARFRRPDLRPAPAS